MEEIRKSCGAQTAVHASELRFRAWTAALPDGPAKAYFALWLETHQAASFSASFAEWFYCDQPKEVWDLCPKECRP